MQDRDTTTAARPGVVRAIDLGFGLVKISRRMPSGEIGFMSFPSIAIPSDLSAIRAVSARNRDTVDVPVGASSYEVGVDVDLAQTANDFGREITEEYYRSPIYAALMKGALRYIGESEIDMLVLGLPVSQYLNDDRRKFLEEQWTTGTDKAMDIGSGKMVKIHRVTVRPQPLGGYVEMFSHLDHVKKLLMDRFEINEQGDVLKLNTLVVDPGEHTLDWLLVQRGNINQKASGAASDAGRHRTVRAVMDALSGKIARPLGAALMPRLNEALRTTMKIELRGEVHDLREFEAVMATSVEDPINRLIEGLRGMIEIVQLIVVVGGHPERYRDELHKRFPSIPIVVFDSSVEANVRGYQTIGETALARMQSANAAVAA